MKRLAKWFILLVVLIMTVSLAVACNDKGGDEELPSDLKVTVSFDLDGGTGDFPDIEVTSGSTLTEPTTYPTKAGYIFDKWQLDSADYDFAIAPTANVTLKATYLPKSFTVTLNNEGKTSKGTVTFGSDFSFSVPQKDNYIFEGWQNADSELLTGTDGKSLEVWSVAKDLTLLAKWKPVDFSITYNLNGGVAGSSNPSTYNIETSDITINDPAKTGYSFEGWFSDETLQTACTKIISKGSVGKKAFYAKWSPVNYTISYDYNGGAIDGENVISYNFETSTFSLINPTKENYSFDGWFSDAEFTSAFDGSLETGSSGNKTFYAKWKPTSFDIVYHLNDGVNNVNNPGSYTIETETFVVNAPTKTGYKFEGWYTDEDCENEYPSTLVEERKVYSITRGSTGEKNFYAKWSAVSYAINYVLSGGESNNPETYTITSDNVELSDPRKTGYAFEGWFIDEELMQPSDGTIAKGSYGDKTFYAKWSAASFSVSFDTPVVTSYSISFDLNGKEGTAPLAQSISASSNIRVPAVPTAEGFAFAGWYRTEACADNDRFDFASDVESPSDFTLYAKWIEVEGGATMLKNEVVSDVFYIEGKTDKVFYFVALSSKEMTIQCMSEIDTFGTLYDAEGNILERSDYNGSDDDFLIRFDAEEGELYYVKARGYQNTTVGNANLVLYGNTVEVKPFTSFLNIKTVELTYGSPFTLPIPVREGYRFLGYYDKPENDTTGIRYTDAEGVSLINWDKAQNDSTLYFRWEPDTFSVFFMVNGGTIAENTENRMEFKTGDIIDLSELVITKEGQTFLGWTMNGAPFTLDRMPVYDITLDANWTPYKVKEIKYDATKTAIKATDDITAELFNITAFDTEEEDCIIEIQIQEGTFAAGETIKLRVVATSPSDATKKAELTINGVKIYEIPTDFNHSFGNTDYINISSIDEDFSDLFGMSGTDTFGGELSFSAAIENEDYEAGETITVVLQARDVAGNVAEISLGGIKLYGTPVISYEEDKLYLKDDASIDTTLFGGISASDSFNEDIEASSIEVSTTDVISAGKVISIKIKATDIRGNINEKVVKAEVYGTPQFVAPTKTNFKLGDTISVEAMGLKAKDSFGNYLTGIEFTQTPNDSDIVAGATLTYKAEVVDKLGLKAEITINDVRIYGTPTLTYATEKDSIKESALLLPSLFLPVAKDSYNESLPVTLRIKSGTQKGGEKMTLVLSTKDRLGNEKEIELIDVKVYSSSGINLSCNTTCTAIKESSLGEELNVTAKDSFGEDANVVVLDYSTGEKLVGGRTSTIIVRATDKVGNIKDSAPISGVKVYGKPVITMTRNNRVMTAAETATNLNNIFSVEDSFGDSTLYKNITLLPETGYVAGDYVTVTVTVTDFLQNESIYEGSFLVVSELSASVVNLVANGGSVMKTSYIIAAGESVTIEPAVREGYTFAAWKNTNGDAEVTDATGMLISPWDEALGITELYAEWTPNVYDITYVLDGGTNNPDNVGSYTVGTTVALLEPTHIIGKRYYKFLGWYDSPYGGYKVDSISNVSGNITLYARWSSSLSDIYTIVGDNIVFGKYPQSELAASTIDALFAEDKVRTNDDGYFYYIDEEGKEVEFVERNDRYFLVEPIEWGIMDVGENGIVLLFPNDLIFVGAYDESGSFVDFAASSLLDDIKAYLDLISTEAQSLCLITDSISLLPVENSDDINGITISGRSDYAGSIINDDYFWVFDVSSEPFEVKLLECTSVHEMLAPASYATIAGIRFVIGLQLERFDVTYVGDDGTTGDSVDTDGYFESTRFYVQNNEKLSKEGYRFVCWNDGTTDYYPNDSYTMPAKDVIFTAKWVKTFDITFSKAEETGVSGEVPTSITMAEGETLIIPSCGTLAKEGYSFVGWKIGDDIYYENERYVLKDSSIELIAIWEKTPFLLLTSVLGKVTPKNKYNMEAFEGMTYTLPIPELTQEGFEFVGWYYYDSLSKVVFLTDETGKSIAPWKAEDGITQVFDKWSLIEYSISYELNGGENDFRNPTSYTRNSIITFIDAKKPTGTGAYVFDGWYDENGDRIERIEHNSVGDITLRASWSKIEETEIHEELEYYREGDYVYFGAYPQTVVTDETIIAALNDGIEANTITADEKTGWFSYNNERYALISSATPHENFYSFSNGGSVIGVGEKYYFRVELIKWRIIKEENDAYSLIADNLLLPKAFNVYDETGANWDLNNWAESELKEWLTASDDEDEIVSFLEMVFNAEQISNVDYLSIMSKGEATNGSYGFNVDELAVDKIRAATTTDYARALGAMISTSEEYYGNGNWWLSTAGNAENTVCVTYYDGKIGGSISTVDLAYQCVRPFIRLDVDNYSNQATLSVNRNGGGDNTSFFVEKGEKVTIDTESLSNVGYRFIGWRDIDTTYVYDLEYLSEVNNTFIIDRNTRLLAIWERVYNISYSSGNANSGETPELEIKAKNETITFAENPYEKTNYAFKGWAVSGETDLYQPGDSYTIDDNDIVITATWKRVYKITYVMNEGENNENNPDTFDEDSGVIYLAVPRYVLGAKCYFFMGWYIGVNRVNYISTELYSSDLTITARWSDTLLQNGDLVYYGQYPQTLVTDYVGSYILNEIEENRLEPNEAGWYEWNGVQYALVEGNPYNVGYQFANGSSITDGRKYLFRVEPIQWRVLSYDAGEVVLMAELLIDTASFNGSTSTIGSGDAAIYPNNWENSDLRAWLNEQFYESAFNEYERELLVAMTKNNDEGYYSDHDNAPSLDYVTLLSYEESINTDYGFDSEMTEDDSREGLVSDYAKAKGAYLNTSTNEGCGTWWLRSSGNGEENASVVLSTGYTGYYVADVLKDNNCVRPVIVLKLFNMD